MTDQLNDVLNFQHHFKLDTDALKRPGFLSQHLAEVRANFMQEELNEYAHACGLVMTTHDTWRMNDQNVVADVALAAAFVGLLDLN